LIGRPDYRILFHRQTEELAMPTVKDWITLLIRRRKSRPVSPIKAEIELIAEGFEPWPGPALELMRYRDVQVVRISLPGRALFVTPREASSGLGPFA
jgi:hypothetical protein